MASGRRFLIVGGGLAGYMLSARLLQAGQRVALADSALAGAASPVAAGLFNVVKSRRPGKVWKAEELLAELNSFFQDPQWASLGRHAHFGPIYHPFHDEVSLETWQSAASMPDYSPYVELRNKPLHPERISNPFGGLLVKQGGWLAVHSFVRDMSELQQGLGLHLMQQQVTEDDIDFDKRILRRSDGTEHEFDDIVFCQGWHGAKNKVFPFLPLVANKGEILQVSIPGLHLPLPVFKKIFLIPLGDDRYTCGSTYTREFADPHPTEQAKSEILSMLRELTPLPARVLSHVAGVRPSSHDWRPIADSHPTMPFVHLFTGFGAFGVLLAPWLSLHVRRYLIDGTALPPEVTLARFNERARRLFAPSRTVTAAAQPEGHAPPVSRTRIN